MRALLVFAGLFGFSHVWSQDGTPVNILDRVQAFDENTVIDMKFDIQPAAPPDFVELIHAPAGSQFEACKLTATLGTFCLTNQGVLHWPTGLDAGGFNLAIDCDDPVLGARSCTGMTVDLPGNIWLAIRTKGKTHNLLKAELIVDNGDMTLDNDDCADPDGEVLTSTATAPTMTDPASGYCATLWAEDKPLLLDLSSVDGDAAAAFTHGKATVGLQERQTAVIFKDDAAKTLIEGPSGKNGWNLFGNEKLLAIAVVQAVNPGTQNTENYLAVTTTKDRVMIASTDGNGGAFEAFDIADNRDPMAVACNPDVDQHYSIRSSLKTALTYISDRQFCQVVALEPDYGTEPHDENTVLIGLKNAKDDNEDDLTLSTSHGMTSIPVLGPTLTPGEFIDLSACGVSCILVAGTNTEMFNVSIVDTGENGMTLFLIEGIPDCRLVGAPMNACISLLGLPGTNPESELINAGVIIDRMVATGSGEPAAQLLNVKQLIPPDVVQAFGEPLPNMWISEWYQAQFDSTNNPAEDGFFTAFFGFTDAQFTGVFDIRVFVNQLAGGYERGCRSGDPDNTPAAKLIFKNGDDQGYDVAVKVSEDFASINKSYIPNPDHEVMLTNTDCGTSRVSGGRWSFWAIDLGFTPDTYDGDMTVTSDDPAVFAHLLASLYDDFDLTVNAFACFAADGQATSPLDTTACADFNSALFNTRDKFDKCVDATTQPKQSSSNQTCQAHEVQLQTLKAVVEGFTVTGEDPANRVSEAKVRLRVIENVYFNLFFPSIPPDGFPIPGM